MKNKTINNSRENNFDFLRLFAAFTVMVGHATVHLNIPFLWVNEGYYWFGDGVAVFFILSGMLVYSSYEKCVKYGRSLHDFYKNRFLRIAPAIYAYVVVTIVLLLLVGAITTKVFTNTSFFVWIMSNIILVPVYYPEIFSHIGVGVLNGVLGTIPMEFSYYLIVPLIFIAEKRFGFVKTIACLFGIGIIGSTIVWIGDMQSVEPMWLKFFKISFFARFIFFILGIFWLRMWNCVPKSKYLFITSIVAYALIVYIFSLGEYFGPFWDLGRGIVLSYAVFWFGYYGPKMLNKITSKIGDLSYGIYIWHMVIVNLFLFLKIPEKFDFLPGIIIHLAIYAITSLFAICSWKFVEQPFLRLKPFTSREMSDSNTKNVSPKGTSIQTKPNQQM